MVGLTWTAALWVIAIGVTRMGSWAAPFRRLSLGLGREHTAMVLLLLAFHSRATRTGAEDSLANPFVAETIARGALAMAALVILVPLFVPNARLALVVRRKLWGVFALGLYFVVAALSVLWSVFFLNTAGKVLEIGIAFALGYVIATRRDSVDAAKRSMPRSCRGPGSSSARPWWRRSEVPTDSPQSAPCWPLLHWRRSSPAPAASPRPIGTRCSAWDRSRLCSAPVGRE
jgi:hypothetical protein